MPQRKNATIWIIAIVAVIIVGMLIQSKFEIFSVLPPGQFNQNDQCTFITNVDYGASESFSDYRDTNGWISVDWNGDGTLEAFGYDTAISSSFDPCASREVITETPRGFEIAKYEEEGGVRRVVLCSGTSGKVFENPSAITSGAVIACDGTTQTGPTCGDLICETGETESSCPADCSTGTGGSCPSFDDVISLANQWVSCGG